MKEYNLGPNGGILTASNLFATRFDQVVTLCEKRRDELDYLRRHSRPRSRSSRGPPAAPS